MDDTKLFLEDGSRIGVIGGGPSGAFFSIFALKMSRMIGKDIGITIYDPKVFTRDGPRGCNKCGGIISERMVQTLALEGINIPPSLLQKGIHSYRLFTECGDVSIQTPSREKTIASIYRGGGPKGSEGRENDSFDQFLLSLAVKEGAVHKPLKVETVQFHEDGINIIAGAEAPEKFDLVVGAFGVNAGAPPVFENSPLESDPPETVKTAIAEIPMDDWVIREHFGNSIFLFLLPIPDLKFAAIIPKNGYVTLCLLGSRLDNKTIPSLLEHPVVKKALPDVPIELACRCVPKMNVCAPRKPWSDRIVMCGDAGSTRLFKDGIGSAYTMGKAIAKTVVFEGFSSKLFNIHYGPVYRDTIRDNGFGRYLFFITDLYKRYRPLTGAMMDVVAMEQRRSRGPLVLSSVLWDVFTGNERYKNIFRRCFNLKMHLALWPRIIINTFSFRR